jgi:hypothetical protein
MKQLAAVLIALALCLAPPAQAAKNTAISSGAAGTEKPNAANQETAPGNPDTVRTIADIRPRSVICVFPAGPAAGAGTKQLKPRERRIKVAPGQNPLTACPKGSKAFPYYGHVASAGTAEERTSAKSRPAKQKPPAKKNRAGKKPATTPDKAAPP